MKYVFFWVLPRRLNAYSRRFGTLYRYFIDLPLKMEPIQCSETSAISIQTPGKHPKENILLDILSNSNLTLILLTWRIVWAPNNASRWQMGFNSVFKGLTLILLTWRIWWAPNNASRWQMGFNSAFNGLTFIQLTWSIWWAPNNDSRWQMGFNSAFKGLR
jgi:hypothetical protein